MKNLTWQNPGQLFVAQELIKIVKLKCCGIKDLLIVSYHSNVWAGQRWPAFSSVKEGNARGGRSLLASFLILPLYMSGEELIWEAAMMIFWCDIAPVVAGCITFSGAKLAGIVILQGHAQLPRNNPQNLTLRIKFGPSWRMDYFGQALQAYH